MRKWLKVRASNKLELLFLGRPREPKVESFAGRQQLGATICTRNLAHLAPVGARN